MTCSAASHRLLPNLRRKISPVQTGLTHQTTLHNVIKMKISITLCMVHVLSRWPHPSRTIGDDDCGAGVERSTAAADIEERMGQEPGFTWDSGAPCIILNTHTTHMGVSSVCQVLRPRRAGPLGCRTVERPAAVHA